MRRCLVSSVSCSCFTALSLAVAVGSAAAASVRFNLPPGHAAESAAPTGSYSEMYAIAAKGDADAGCVIGFQKTGSTGITQDQLNEAAAKPEYAKTIEGFIGDQSVVTSIEPFELAGVRGMVATGDAKGAPMRMMFVMLQTPKGRTNATCVGPEGRFAALRPEFDAIVRGIVLPR